MGMREHTHAHTIVYLYTYTHTSHNNNSKKKRQLAHKLCLMNFNDAFCSYLFGENPITTSIQASIRLLLRHERPDASLYTKHPETLYVVLIDWLACIFILCEYNTKMNSSKIQCGCNERKREHMKLSYFNQIWINSMDNGGTRKLEINL